MKQTLIANQVFDGKKIVSDLPITFEDGVIVALDTVSGATETRMSGMICPGFIDIQVNGGGGVLFNENPSEQSIQTIISAHARFGTTGCLPTLITDDLDVMTNAANAVSSALDNDLKGLLGIHFEGPHLSSRKRGVHSEKHIRELSDYELEIYARKDIGIRHITVAPETVSSDVIRVLTEMGVIVSLGHSDADYQTVKEALDAGAKGFTHLFNAMSPVTSRSPGMVGAALSDQNSWCSIIADGHHVHPASMKMAVSAKPQGKIMLVTDAMSPVGTDFETFELLGEEIKNIDGKLIASEGQLAGSVLDMALAVRNIVNMVEVPIEEAFRMASVYPAKFLGTADNTAQIEMGKKANLVLLDKDLNVGATFIEGMRYY